MTVTDIALIVAGVGWVLARRMAGQLLEIKGLLLAPVVLTVVGLGELHHLRPADATTVVFAGAGIVLSVGLGVLRGRTVHLGTRDGRLWMRYRVPTVLLWVLNLALKGVALPVEHAISPASTSAAGHTLLLALGLGLLAETGVVLLRALHTDAAVAWTKGEDGAPPAAAPAFERVRAAVREHGSLAAAGRRLRDDRHDW